jgi:hypothetical protein
LSHLRIYPRNIRANLLDFGQLDCLAVIVYRLAANPIGITLFLCTHQAFARIFQQLASMVSA